MGSTENFKRLIKTNKLTETYEILNELGEGSFGKVVKARFRVTGEQRAIKII